MRSETKKLQREWRFRGRGFRRTPSWTVPWNAGGMHQGMNPSWSTLLAIGRIPCWAMLYGTRSGDCNGLLKRRGNIRQMHIAARKPHCPETAPSAEVHGGCTAACMVAVSCKQCTCIPRQHCLAAKICCVGFARQAWYQQAPTVCHTVTRANRPCMHPSAVTHTHACHLPRLAPP